MAKTQQQSVFQAKTKERLPPGSLPDKIAEQLEQSHSQSQLTNQLREKKEKGNNHQAEIIKKGILGKHNLKESLTALRTANNSVSPRKTLDGVLVLSKSSVRFKSKIQEKQIVE